MPERNWVLSTPSGGYTISTNPVILSHTFINTAFASEEMYWATPLPDHVLTTLLANSLNLGLYKLSTPPHDIDIPPPRTASSPSTPRDGSPTTVDETAHDDPLQAPTKLKQVGFARFITDHVSTFYLTDVYVAPEHRGRGLGEFLIGCCGEIIQEAEEAKHLRRALLMASPDKGKKYYERELAMWDINDEGADMVCMTRSRFRRTV